MTHEAFQDRLLELAYGELPGREARKVEAHAASCDSCRSELARIRETRRAMSALPDDPAPERGEGVLLAAARERCRSRRPARGLPRWLFAGSVAAISAVAVIAVSYRILEMRPGPMGRSDGDALLGGARPAPAAATAPVGDASAPAAAAGAKAEEGAAGPRAGELPDVAQDGEDRLAERGGRPANAKRAPAGEPSRFAEPPAPSKERVASHPPPAAADAAPWSAPPAAAGGGAPPRAAPAGEGQPAAAPAEEGPSAFTERKTTWTAPRSRADPAGERAGAFVEREAAPAAPRSLSAPEPAPAPGAVGRSKAAPRSASAADALRRYEALRSEGRLAGEIRTFPGCTGEAWRKVERDPEGRVVAYVREGTIRGARFRAEAIYGEDGQLARARALPLDGGPAPDAEALVPRDASLAESDLPPRCGP